MLAFQIPQSSGNTYEWQHSRAQIQHRSSTAYRTAEPVPSQVLEHLLARSDLPKSCLVWHAFLSDGWLFPLLGLQASWPSTIHGVTQAKKWGGEDDGVGSKIILSTREDTLCLGRNLQPPFLACIIGCQISVLVFNASDASVGALLLPYMEHFHIWSESVWTLLIHFHLLCFIWFCILHTIILHFFFFFMSFL